MACKEVLEKGRVGVVVERVRRESMREEEGRRERSFEAACCVLGLSPLSTRDEMEKGDEEDTATTSTALDND